MLAWGGLGGGGRAGVGDGGGGGGGGKWAWTFITETSPCAIGNFCKCLLYKCFMSLSLIVIQTNIKFLK